MARYAKLPSLFQPKRAIRARPRYTRRPKAMRRSIRRMPRRR